MTTTTKRAADLLRGGTVLSVGHLTPEQIRARAWYCDPRDTTVLLVKIAGGGVHRFVIACDPEGNGPGDVELA